MEEITTRDESSHIAANGQRLLPSGGISADGPPTTLSGTGIDRMAFLQANITRDNTKFVNGAVVGERNVFQVCLLNEAKSCVYSVSFKLCCLLIAGGSRVGNWKQIPFLQPPPIDLDKIHSAAASRRRCWEATATGSSPPRTLRWLCW